MNELEEKAFAETMQRIELLRKARIEQLERHIYSEWECFMHFACENSLLRKQAE